MNYGYLGIVGNILKRKIIVAIAVSLKMKTADQNLKFEIAHLVS